ncbi:hypothetical protein [Onishia taeanensis]|uniref:hypothetical protein n=1 Tax=Onishia taeanensis TaxID=284577 RepID=UPI000B8672B3|nr:hypothetical protein [Halomonas taeanensis]
MKGLLQFLKRKRRRDKAVDESPAIKLFLIFLIQVLVCIVLLQVAAIYVSFYYSPTDVEFMTQIKELDPSAYVGMAVLMIGYLKITKTMNFPIALAAIFSVFMAVSSQLIALIPADIDIPGGDEPGQAAIFGPVTLLFSSMIGISINLVWAIFQAVEQAAWPKDTNQDPT